MALEVSAAIIGILAAAGQVAKTLEPVVSAFVHAPQHAHTILTEVKQTRTVLSGLQALFDDLGTSPKRRKELIRVDALVVSLTDGVLLFSALEALVDQLGEIEPKESILIRTQWARHKKELDSILSRLLSFKISINLVLSILQCDSDLDAQRDRKQLLDVTAKLLASNVDLAKRIADLEHCYHSSNSAITRPSTRRASNVTYSTGTDDDDSAEPSPMPASISLAEARRRSHFEHDLEASRVYSKVRRKSADYSFRSSVAPSHAWSALSDISLADLSTISVIALPLHRDDVKNVFHCKDRDADSDEVVPDWPHAFDGVILVNQTVEIKYESLADEGLLFSSVPSISGPLKFPELDVRPSTKLTLMVKGAPTATIQDLFAKFAPFSKVLDTTSYCERAIPGYYCNIDGVSVHTDIVINPEFEILYDMVMLISAYELPASCSFVEQYRPQFRHWEALQFPPTMIVGYQNFMNDRRAHRDKILYKKALAKGCAFWSVADGHANSLEQALHELIRTRWTFENLQAERFQNHKRHAHMLAERKKRAKELLAAREAQSRARGINLQNPLSAMNLQSLDIVDEESALMSRPLGEHGW
ncbi:hypothetical protein EK21DRAFT_92455 [Setomelanomma holmii]|uniref:Fungal N-terminal domain-containing protein n=1 Tax=Setomelanomma holmii TaxID=210430 RepID=A0A9P4H3G6_9PLEO|nr:hypothetical protein EK21DRAFT_92455 [Setomelanomma holmii]